LPARQLGIKDRGVLREGAHADVVIFDPDRVIDKASFAEPYQASEGIETVIINGEPVLHEGIFRADEPSGQIITRS
jgi:N-acyl-D-aspartate/D-glutamate deacylase